MCFASSGKGARPDRRAPDGGHGRHAAARRRRLAAEGMVLKTSDPALLIDCMETVARARRWVDPEIAERMQPCQGACGARAFADAARARAGRPRPAGPAQPRHRRSARGHRGNGEGLSARHLRQARRRQPNRARNARRRPARLGSPFIRRSSNLNNNSSKAQLAIIYHGVKRRLN